MNQKLN